MFNFSLNFLQQIHPSFPGLHKQSLSFSNISTSLFQCLFSQNKFVSIYTCNIYIYSISQQQNQEGVCRRLRLSRVKLKKKNLMIYFLSVMPLLCDQNIATSMKTVYFSFVDPIFQPTHNLKWYRGFSAISGLGKMREKRILKNLTLNPGASKKEIGMYCL